MLMVGDTDGVFEGEAPVEKEGVGDTEPAGESDGVEEGVGVCVTADGFAAQGEPIKPYPHAHVLEARDHTALGSVQMQPPRFSAGTDPAPQVVQVAAPASAKVPAAQGEHTVLDEPLQACATTSPSPHAEHSEQAMSVRGVHGPETNEPAAQDAAHATQGPPTTPRVESGEAQLHVLSQDHALVGSVHVHTPPPAVLPLPATQGLQFGGGGTPPPAGGLG